VGDELKKLLLRLSYVLSERGKKAALASFLKVPRPRVSEWLSGGKEPGGETTLRMLAWVQAEEAKQPKSSGRVRARPEPKTRKTKAFYDKRKSGHS
jgi:hypothetical protein